MGRFVVWAAAALPCASEYPSGKCQMGGKCQVPNGTFGTCGLPDNCCTRYHKNINPLRPCVSERCQGLVPEAKGSCMVEISGPEADRNCGAPVSQTPGDRPPDDGFICFGGCSCTIDKPCSILWRNWTKHMLPPEPCPMNGCEDGKAEGPSGDGHAGLRVQFAQPSSSGASPGTCYNLVVTKVQNFLGFVPDTSLTSLVVKQKEGCARTPPWGQGHMPAQTAADANDSYYPRQTEKGWRGFNHSQLWDRARDGDHCNGGVCNLKLVSQAAFASWLTLKPVVAASELDHSNSGSWMADNGESFIGWDGKHTDGVNTAYIQFILSPCAEAEVKTSEDITDTVVIDIVVLLACVLWVTVAWVIPYRLQQWCRARRGVAAATAGADMSSRLLGDPTSVVDRAASISGDPVRKVQDRREQEEWRKKFFHAHPLLWPYRVVVEPDETIVRVAGVRAVKYIKFQRQLLILLVKLNFLGLVVLVPTNYSGDQCKRENPSQTPDLFCLLSSKNAGQSQLYVHILLTLAFSVLTYAFSKRHILGRGPDQSMFLTLVKKPAVLADHVRQRAVHMWPSSKANESGADDAASDVSRLAAAADGKMSIAASTSASVADLPSMEPSSVAPCGAQARAADEGFSVDKDGFPPAVISAETEPEPEPSPDSLEWARKTGFLSFVVRDPSEQQQGGMASISLDEGGSGRTQEVAAKSSPAPYTLMVRRVSTQNEMFHPDNQAWLTTSLQRIFHHPPHWEVVDILIYRCRARHFVDCPCLTRKKLANDCTAFITFKSSKTPADIIRVHRAATEKRCFGVFWFLAQCISTTVFFCCPRCSASIKPSKSLGISRATDKPSAAAENSPVVFGWSRESADLGMKNWELHPGPVKDDVVWDALNRPTWHRTVRTVVLGILLFMLSILMVFPAIVISKFFEIVNLLFSDRLQLSDGQCPTESQHSQSIQFKGSEDCAVHFGINSCTFIEQYIPSLVALIINVGILPLFIDGIAMVLEKHFLHSNVYRSILRKNLALLLATTLLLPMLAISSPDELLGVLRQEVSQFRVAVNIDQGSLCPPPDCGDAANDGTDTSGQDVSQATLTVRALKALVLVPIKFMYHGFGSHFFTANVYFYRYTIHAALLGLAASLLLLPKKAYSFISFILCQRDAKKLVWEFPLEYNYAVVSCMFGVTLTYSIAHPPMLLLGLLYGICKCFADKHALLFAHEGNLDEHFVGDDNLELYKARGTTTQNFHEHSLDVTVHNFMLVVIVIFQVAMYGFLSERRGSFVEEAILLFVLLFTVLVWARRVCMKRSTKVMAEMVSELPSSSSPRAGDEGTSSLGGVSTSTSGSTSTSEHDYAVPLATGYYDVALEGSRVKSLKRQGDSSRRLKGDKLETIGRL